MCVKLSPTQLAHDRLARFEALADQHFWHKRAYLHDPSQVTLGELTQARLRHHAAKLALERAVKALPEQWVASASLRRLARWTPQNGLEVEGYRPDLGNPGSTVREGPKRGRLKRPRRRAG